MGVHLRTGEAFLLRGFLKMAGRNCFQPARNMHLFTEANENELLEIPRKIRL